MKIVVIIGFIAMMLSGCTKLHDDKYDERIQRPNLDIEIPTDPSWDTIPQADDDIIMEILKNRSK